MRKIVRRNPPATPADSGTAPPARPADPLAAVLEIGLGIVVFAAPLPFGAVVSGGRLALEIAALALLLLWLIRAARRSSAIPGRAACAGILGLLALAAIQIAPLGGSLVERISPRVMELRTATIPDGATLRAEQRMLGIDPADLAPAPTLSVDPGATASALRTGAAIAALFLVATTVAAARGLRRIALALLVSASFQGLYGLLVLASGHDMIWHLAKQHYLDSATGTFVNRNHFAGYMAMSLASGCALILHNFRKQRRVPGRPIWDALLGHEGSRNLLLGLLLIVGLAGLLASLSRAGIAFGLLALAATILIGGRFQRLQVRVVVAALILAVALVPLAQLGAERLIDRYARSAENLVSDGGRARVWLDTLDMGASFPLCGVGFGAFRSAYPLHRSPDVRLLYVHAHNDLLQAAAEGGAVGLLFLGLLLAAVGRSAIRGLAGLEGTLGVGFAAGLVAILLHALVDFNFHIPSNAAVAAVLAGCLGGLPCRNAT